MRNKGDSAGAILSSLVPTLILDARRYEAFEIAARLDMLLVAPNASAERMERLVRAACSDQIAATIEAYPERRADLLEKWPDYDPRTNRVERKNIVTERGRLEGLARNIRAFSIVPGTSIDA